MKETINCIISKFLGVKWKYWIWCLWLRYKCNCKWLSCDSAFLFTNELNFRFEKHLENINPLFSRDWLFFWCVSNIFEMYSVRIKSKKTVTYDKNRSLRCIRNVLSFLNIEPDDVRFFYKMKIVINGTLFSADLYERLSVCKDTAKCIQEESKSALFGEGYILISIPLLFLQIKALLIMSSFFFITHCIMRN